jgi:hypothetical protein
MCGVILYHVPVVELVVIFTEMLESMLSYMYDKSKKHSNGSNLPLPYKLEGR